jgi:hypothetical protein
MTDMDEHSLQTGRMLEAIEGMGKTIANLSEKTDKGFAEMGGKLDITTKQQIIAEQSIKSAHKRIDKFEPHVDSYIVFRSRWLGFFTGFTILNGAITSLLVFLKRIS